MSYPILYKADETDFSHMGLGILKDCSKCIVTEERNGVFELELEYPISGIKAKELTVDRLLKVNVANYLKNQRFRIIRVTRPIRGFVKAFAEHVSYLTYDSVMAALVEYGTVDAQMNGQQALNKWKANVLGDAYPGSVYSDIDWTTYTTLTLETAKNAREHLGGVKGSILYSWNGEYKFDNYNISLLKARGKDTGVWVSYGRNITQFEQDELIDETYTSIYPYMVVEDPVTNLKYIKTLASPIVDSAHVNKYARKKILQVDFSNSNWKKHNPKSNYKLQDTVIENDVIYIATTDVPGSEENPIAITNTGYWWAWQTCQEHMAAQAAKYIADNQVGIPQVSIKLDFVDLNAATAINKPTDLALCDNVNVRFEQLNIDTKSKIVKIKWNVLADRYDEIELGTVRPSLTSVLSKIFERR